ncbi:MULTISPECIES: carbonic anhydrase [unclassified Rubrivivax]|uniref:carbonic anhydrase n=1 Tax=unclassified Rubrivivax TaxID=2649762 RepID=UPI0021078229|nr:MULTISPECIES: carbonic anhydrase [unclassified Rubrivivax]
MNRSRPAAVRPAANPAWYAWAVLPVAAALLFAPPSRASERGAPPAKAAASAAPEAEPLDPLDRVRERLAEKLGAMKAPDTPGNVLRISSRVPGDAPAARKPAPRPRPEPVPAPEIHWNYTGEGGPARWGALRPEFGLCARGQRQSPIDIRGGIAVDLEEIVFDYRPAGFAVLDNGHTVQVNVGPGNVIAVGGRRYELQQFHFHRPSEERIDGRQSEMVAHLVHRDPEGRLAVVAVLLQRGEEQPVVQSVWNNLPLEKHDEARASGAIDLGQLLPADRGYYTYMGSLTTPPCTEGVLWIVMRQPVAVSQEQIDIFARIYPMNARPVQPSSGRLIKQSR